MSDPPDIVEVTKSDRRTSKTTLQEENDIKEVITASSIQQARIGISPRDPSIFAYATTTTPQQKTTPEALPLSTQTKGLGGLSPRTPAGGTTTHERSAIRAEGSSLHQQAEVTPPSRRLHGVWCQSRIRRRHQHPPSSYLYFASPRQSQLLPADLYRVPFTVCGTRQILCCVFCRPNERDLGAGLLRLDG